MISKKSLFVTAALVFTGFFGVCAANAQSTTPNQSCFTLASLQGSYQVVSTYGANVALALGTGYYDGSGNLSRTAIVNQPTPGSANWSKNSRNSQECGNLHGKLQRHRPIHPRSYGEWRLD